MRFGDSREGRGRGKDGAARMRVRTRGGGKRGRLGDGSPSRMPEVSGSSREAMSQRSFADHHLSARSTGPVDVMDVPVDDPICTWYMVLIFCVEKS
jgi:hypothetical protein